MQFTSPIIVALLLAVSTSSVTAAQTTSNLRSGGRKLHEDNELTLPRELRVCDPRIPIIIQSGDTCDAIHNTCDGDWSSLECVSAGRTCSKDNSKLIAGDSCRMSNGCKVVNGEEDLHAAYPSLCSNGGGCPSDQWPTCCEQPGYFGHPGYTYYCN